MTSIDVNSEKKKPDEVPYRVPSPVLLQQRPLEKVPQKELIIHTTYKVVDTVLIDKRYKEHVAHTPQPTPESIPEYKEEKSKSTEEAAIKERTPRVFNKKPPTFDYTAILIILGKCLLLFFVIFIEIRRLVLPTL